MVGSSLSDSKKQEKDSLVSVVADLRHASLQTTRFISETLILLELHRRTVHGVYIIQPKKKDTVKLLLKLLAPSRSYTTAFKKVLLKEISELSNYIDRSQLTVPLGGYFIYCHRSWAAFIKEIDVFVQEFLSVVQRLPSCISTLHALSRLPMPSTFSELQNFCSTNEAKFQQLRRELGLDELLKHCESVVEKLRYPEKDPCYQAMAGTALFTHTAFDMLQNHSRITAGVDKVELLWQQAFSKARLQLQVFQLREDALQITEQIQTLQEDKLQPYKMEIAKDAAGAVMLVSEFEVSIHTPAMALVWCAEDVINTWAEILPCDGQTREPWVLDLERLKEKLRSGVHFILQTLRAVSTYHHNYNKASGWYSLVLCENFLQELLSGVNGDAAPSQRQRSSWRMIPAWRHKLSSFLKKNPPPDVEQLVHLAHLSNIIQDDGLQQAGKQMSQRSSDVSLKDWDVREQEGLREVEQILHRADDILEKEEHVLAQEAVLDALLRCEEQNNQWPPWDREDQLSVMSSNELTEAGVVGLEDYLVPAESFSLSEPTSAACTSETKTSEDNGWCTAAATGAQTGAFHGTPDLLTELSNVHALDELIVEEKLKIQELRRCKENEDSSESKPSDTSGLLSISKDRETFLLQLEKEKREVDKLEKSLGKDCEVKKHQDRAGKVNCSIMEKARSETTEDRVLCDEFLSGSFSRTNSTSLVHNFSQAQDTWETEHMQAEATPEVLAALPDPHCEDHCSEILMAQLQRSNLTITSNLKKFCGEEAVQPQGCIDRIDTDGRAENSTKRKPEASLTTEMRPSNREYDPGGRSHLPPVPEPIKALLPVNDDLEELVTPHSAELNPALSAVSQHPGIVQLDVQDKPLNALLETVSSASSHILFINANVKEHCNNNNNNHALPEQRKVSVEHLSQTSTEDEEEMSGAPACSLRTDSWPEDEIQSLSPPQQSAPQQPHQQLELDSPGRDEQNDGVMRPGSWSVGIQAPPNISLIELTDFKTPIVLDTGSGLIKAGFADQDLPSIVFPTIIGMPKYEEIMNGNLERETYIGHEAQHMRGVLTLKHPIMNGIIRNWDEMEKIWHHTFQQLRVDPENHPVLLTEAAMNPSENRQRMVEIMFENFSVPFTYVAMQAVLALYAAGRSTGVVFDSGDDVSHSVPVFEGYCLPHAVQRFPLAGIDVTMHLKKLLQEQGVSMRTTAETEIVREMKEKCCSVALNYEDELSAGGSSYTEMHYTMPDGQIVTLSTERFRAPEILFKPELIGRDHCGMHQSVFKSILSSDIDLRRCFLGNIVLSGGNTLLAGLPERLQAEVKGLVPSDMWESVRVTSPKDRDFSVWSGGAVLANLPTFSSAWISQEEYEEYGPQIVYRKCF
uniref:Si:ch211-241j12.3 n=1 Tax=Sparus aurata TaxID=8175 RepID=A0A671TZD3_SPAAU